MKFFNHTLKKAKPIIAFTGIILRIIMMFLWGGVKLVASMVTKHV